MRAPLVGAPPPLEPLELPEPLELFAPLEPPELVEFVEVEVPEPVDPCDPDEPVELAEFVEFVAAPVEPDDDALELPAWGACDEHAASNTRNQNACLDSGMAETPRAAAFDFTCEPESCSR
jgi:hypothetical protein